MLLLLSLVLSGFILSASMFPLRAASTGWSQTYGGAKDDKATCVIQTSDGGYVIAGVTSSFGAGGDDFWIVKTDASGNMQWNQTYGGPENDQAAKIIQTGGGGYAIIGTTWSYGDGESDIWLIKTDSSGNRQWDKTYGETKDDTAASVVQTADGGYALAGTIGFEERAMDFVFFRTDASGNVLWGGPSTLGPGDEIAADMTAINEEKYVSVGFGDNHSIFVSILESGDWMGIEDQGATQHPLSIIGTGDKSCEAAGYVQVEEGNRDFCLTSAVEFEVSQFGTTYWSIANTATYGGPEKEEAFSLVQADDGGYALAGYTESSGNGGRDYWLVKTDADGNMQWNQTYGGMGTDEARSLVQASDGGYVLAGFADSYGAGGKDFWLVRTDENGVVPEFPTPILVPLFVSLITIAVLVHKRRSSKSHVNSV